MYGEYDEGYGNTDAVICDIQARDIEWEGGWDSDTDTWQYTVIRTMSSPPLMEPPNIEGAVRCIEVASVGSLPTLSVTVLMIPRVYIIPPTHLHRSPIISPF